jgi:hypothetical protein
MQSHQDKFAFYQIIKERELGDMLSEVHSLLEGHGIEVEFITGLLACKEQGVDPYYFTEALSAFLKNNPKPDEIKPDEIKTVSDLIITGLLACKEQGVDPYYFTEALSAFLKNNPKPDEIKPDEIKTVSDLIITGLLAYKEQGVNPYYFTEALSAFLENKPKPDEIKTVSDLIITELLAYKEQGVDPYYFTEALSAFLKNNPKPDEINALNTGLLACKEQGVDPYYFTEALSAFLKNNPKPDEIKPDEIKTVSDLIITGLLACKEQGVDPYYFTKALSAFLENNPKPDEINALNTGLLACKEQGVDPSYFTEALSAFLENKPKPDEIKALNTGLLACKEEGVNPEYFTTLLTKLFGYNLQDYRTEFENYSNALKTNLYQGKEILIRLADILIRTEIINRSRNPVNSKDYGALLSFDQVPWSSINQPDLVHKAFAQNFEIMLNSITRGRGSLSEAYACRKVGDKLTSQYEDFLLWLRTDTLPKTGNWKTENFPGNGWIFSNIKLSPTIKDYVSSLTAWSPKTVEEEPLKLDQAKSRSESILDDLTNSKIYKLRGALIISPEQNNRTYRLPSHTYPAGESFSYIVYNDHFDNKTNATSLLVPTRIIEDSANDLSQLKAEVLRNNPDVLDFGSMSVFNGSLTNARKPESGPYHKWETEKKKERETTDLTGHVHKSHIFGGYIWYNRELLSSQLEEFRKDHLAIYEITNRFQTMNFQLDLLEDLHIKGYANTETTKPDDNSESPEEDSGELKGDMNYLTSLRTAWHKLYKIKPDPEEFSALLVDAPLFDKHSRVTDWTIAYDPRINKFFRRTETGMLQFDQFANEIDEADLQKLLQNPERTARFLPQNFVEIDLPEGENNDN